jgi:hypothetical protein
MKRLQSAGGRLPHEPLHPVSIKRAHELLSITHPRSRTRLKLHKLDFESGIGGVPQAKRSPGIFRITVRVYGRRIADLLEKQRIFHEDRRPLHAGTGFELYRRGELYSCA